MNENGDGGDNEIPEEVDVPDEVDVERVPQFVAGRHTAHLAERVEYTRPSVVRAGLIVVAVAVGAVVVVLAATVLWWMVIAAVVGALLYPAKAWLQRRLPAAVALLVIVAVVLGLAGWLGVHGLGEVKGQTDAVRASATASAQQAEASTQYGATAQRIGVLAKVNAAFDAVPGASSPAGAPLQLVTSAGGALFSIAMLSLLFAIFWPVMFMGALRQGTRSAVRHNRLGVHLRRSYRACARYGWLMIARAAVIGGCAAGVAVASGAPAPTLIGVWFAFASFIPGVGLVIAVLPLAALEAVHAPATAAGLLVLTVAVQAVDATVVQPRIDRGSVRVGPSVSLVALMIGFELYGIGGALVTLAAFAYALAAVASLTAARGDLTDAVKDLTRSDEDTMTGRQTTAAVTETDGAVTWWYELGWRAPLLGALTVVAAAAVVAVSVAGPAVALTATALLLSFGFDPLISRFQRWVRLPRGVTVGLFFCALTAVAVGGVVAFAPSTIDQAATTQQDLPRAVNDLTALPVVGPVLADNHAPDRIREWADALPAQLSTDSSGVTAAASTVGTAVLGALLIVFLLISFLIDGPHLVQVLTVAIPEQRVAVLSRAGTVVAKTAGRYFSGSLVLAGLQAVQVLVTGLLLGVPLTPVLALWAGIWTMVPQVGGAIGGLPFILLAFSHSATSGLIAVAVFGLYLVIANNVLLPVIVGKAVNVSPLATMAATIAGFTLLGVIGAILAVPIFGATKSIYKQLHPSEPKPRDPPRRPPRLAPGRVRTGLTQVRARAEGVDTERTTAPTLRTAESAESA